MLSITPRREGESSESTPGDDVVALTPERAAPRRAAAEVPWITGVRFTPGGADAKLVNISEKGVLTACSGRVSPNATVLVKFEGTVEPQTVQGRVVRTEVAAMGRDGRLGYNVAIAFATRVQIDREPPAPAEWTPTTPDVARAPARNRW